MADVLFLGHGPPRVADQLHLWLIARDPPDPQLAAELAATLPEDLRDWALDDSSGGSVGWHADVLYINSGMGVRYLVKTLDPNHLAWLPEEVSDADIERILDEVMDGERQDAKAPSVSEWDVFGALIGQWVEQLHARWPLWIVVVGRTVKPPGTARHLEAAGWTREHLGEVAARHGALVEQSAASYGATGWGAPVVASYLADKAKPSEATRNVLLQLLLGSGMVGMALGSKLVGMWPKKQRPVVVARLLREGHELGLPLLAAPASHRFLLDDDVFAAAMTPRLRLFPGDMVQVVNKRMMAPKLGDQQLEWLRRMLAVAELNATQRPASEEPVERHRWWLELTNWLDGTWPAH